VNCFGTAPELVSNEFLTRPAIKCHAVQTIHYDVSKGLSDGPTATSYITRLSQRCFARFTLS
jgi:hypothetical protein